MIELFIENNKVDISQEISTLLSYSIDDVRDFGAKNTTVSKTVILPGTKNNNALFGAIFEVSGANNYDSTKPNVGINFNAAISAKMVLFQSNIQAVKGIMQLMQIVKDNGFIEYEVGLFGELSGFTAKLGNKKLEDLDFAAYNQSYTIANIVASWNNAAGGSGLYYPLIDYGTYSTLKHNWDYGTFRPALFVKEYIDKIFTASGYTYDCALFNTTRFKGLIVPHNQKQLTKLTTAIMSASRSVSGHVVDSATALSVKLQFATFISSLFTATISNSRFTYTGAATNTFNFGYSITGNYVGQAVGFNIRIKKNGVDISATIQNYAATGTTFVQYYSYSGSVDIIFITGDYVEVEFQPSAPIYGGDYITATTGSIGITSLVPALAPIVLGDLTDLNSTIPKNILQKEFISSILKLFNCYLFEDAEQDKLLKIMPFVEFYAAAPILDWSLKVDRSKPEVIKPMSELNSRYFEFNYKKDADFYNDLYDKRYNQNYGSYIYDSEYEFAKETTKVEVIFSGTPIVGYTGEDKVYSTIFKKSGTTEETIDSNLRILQAKKVLSVTSWDIKDGATVLGSYTNYGYAGHLSDPDAPTNDLNLGVPKELFFTLVTGAININQFNLYWSSYMAEITDKDSRFLTVTMKLSLLDIYNLSFKNLIMIDGVLFRLNKIIDFNVNVEDTCKAEFLKVINKIY